MAALWAWPIGGSALTDWLPSGGLQMADLLHETQGIEVAARHAQARSSSRSTSVTWAEARYPHCLARSNAVRLALPSGPS